MRITVCIATYNGRSFIKPQLESVLNQLHADDEVLIVDDFSNDNTLEIIDQFTDSRIKVFKNEMNLGVVRSFEIAISKASNDYVFLCDQDDVWKEDKVQRFKKVFMEDSEVTLVISNAEIIDQDGNTTNSLFFKDDFKGSFLRNLLSNSFLGCCMAFKKNKIDRMYPFPLQVPMHDSWIGLNHILYGKVHYIKEPLLYYRRHGGNVTTGKRADLTTVLKWRFVLVKSLTERFFLKNR